ncbi:MAG: SIS domain-containing protein [Chthoniobacterales bacterium]
MSTPNEQLEWARRVFEIELNEAAQVAERLDESFVSAVELIRKAVENRGKIVVLGVGKSGHIGEKIASTLTSTGSTAVVLNSLNALHGDLGVVSDGDVVLALSASGETDELLNVLPALAQFDVRIIALTGNSESSLGRAAAVTIDVGVTREACPLNLAPTSSTTAMLIVGDALAMVLLEARGFKKEDFAKFHPGGQLGQSLLLKVSQIMRPLDRLPITRADMSIVDVIKEMTSRRAGATAIVDDAGQLAGIFTHGDFARNFPNVPDLGQQKVGEFMTREPITVDENSLAASVLNLLREHHIDDLIVLDSNKKPIGLVDSQDLSRLKIL